MKNFHRLAIASCAVLLFASFAAAQQKPAEQTTEMIPVKVKVVLSEYAGTKEISSLPYTLTVNAVSGPEGDPRVAGAAQRSGTDLRMGVRVPINTGPPVAASSPGGPVSTTQFQYMNVGTDIDCWAMKRPDDTYQLNVRIDRNSVYQPSGGKGLGVSVASGNPAILTFSVSNTLLLRDGQTDESTIASDPVSGHLLRVSVTLHVVKAP